MSDTPPVTTLLARLSRWFERHCNDDWEHQYGIRIETCDNPGWIVRIDLHGTGLASKPFDPVREGVDEDGWQLEDFAPWLDCSVEEATFMAAGDPTRLEEILQIFLTWAEE